MMRTRLLVVIALSLSWAGTTWAQPTSSWTLRPRQWPTARLEAPMVYDSVNQRVVVFGGYDHAYRRNNEVWEYYPASQWWRNVTPSAGAQPARRSGSSMAYDSARQRIVLFGGLDDARVHLGDTWEWDCNARTWTQRATGGTPGTDKPTARQGTQMVFDPGRDRVVLFGGVDPNKFYRDTWLYDASAHTWSKLTTTYAPSQGREFLLARAFHGMTITSGTTPNNRIFVFAGEGYHEEASGLVNPVLQFEDIWELVGSVWTDRTPSPPIPTNDGACSNAAACPGKAGWRAFSFDAAGNRLVSQGGYFFTITPPTAGNLQSAWGFSLASGTWTQISANIAGNANASARDSHAFVYLPTTGRLMLYGGYLADIWELSGSAWTSPPSFDPRTSFNVYTYTGQDYHALAWDSLRNRILAVPGGAAEVWSVDPSSWSWTVRTVFGFTERVGHAVAYSPVLDRMLMFGGRCKSLNLYQTHPDGNGATCGPSGTLFNDLRGFNPATNTWTTITPAGGPPPARWDHTFVYDPANNEFLLYGGRTATDQPFNDTWVLACSGPTTCSWSTGFAGPPGRFGHAAAYDPADQRIVLVGGDSGAGAYGDVWKWNGATNSWANVTPPGTIPGVTAPTARRHPGLAALGGAAGGLLLFGGNDGSPRNDSWIWAGTQWLAALPGGGSAPRARENPELVLVPSVARLFAFGGFDGTGLLPADAALVTRMLKGDMDSSDSTDLMLRSPTTSNPVLWEMSGINRLAELPATASLAVGEQVVGVDDFDFDGRNDLVVWHSSTGLVTFWMMNGPTRLGTATLSGSGPLATTWKPTATADFNHDGRPDLLWRNSSTQKLAIWAMTGTTLAGSYAPTPDQAVDANWEVIGALDYNADSNTDLLWYNPVSGKIVFWFLNYDAIRITGQFANPSNAGNNNWKVLASGDYGAGGGPSGSRDLVWRNATSGRFVVWYMDTAANRLGGVFTNPMEPSPSPVAWTIVGPR